MLIRGERNGREELWVVEVLLLFRCLMKEDSAADEIAFVRYTEYVAPLDEVH